MTLELGLTTWLGKRLVSGFGMGLEPDLLLEKEINWAVTYSMNKYNLLVFTSGPLVVAIDNYITCVN